MKIINLESINSTNTFCNYLLTNPTGLPQHLRPDEITLPVAVVADEQFGGRGRFGRSFYSPAKSGIYLSYANEGRYEIADLLKITVVVAALVHRVLQRLCGDELSIKWVNDIYRGSHKIAGILCERVDDPASGRYYIIVGVGVNLFPCEVPDELKDVMGCLIDEGDEAVNGDKAGLRARVTDELIEALDAVLGESETAEFDALIEYYMARCRDVPKEY